MSKRILVIFGGISNENEISVVTGTLAANVLQKGGEEAIAVYIAQDGVMYTGEELLRVENFKENGFLHCNRAIVANGGIYVLNRRGKAKKFFRVDAALNCCHGGAGEGGAVCGLCKLAGIPLASAGIFESAAFMDKYLTKLVLLSLGIDVLPYVYVRSLAETEECSEIGFPAVVKPVSLGSSIGVERVENGEELRLALESAFIYDSGAIVERCVENMREINCAACFIGGKIVTSACEEAISSGGLLSFEDKYEGGGRSVLPAEIPSDKSDKIKDIVRTVYEKLNMRGIVRFDFILEGDKIWLSEVNTVPGSLSYYLLSGGFTEFYGLLQAVIAQAIDDFKTEKSKKLIRTGILENIPLNACKRGAK